jgi:hypothetical protein
VAQAQGELGALPELTGINALALGDTPKCQPMLHRLPKEATITKRSFVNQLHFTAPRWRQWRQWRGEQLLTSGVIDTEVGQIDVQN